MNKQTPPRWPLRLLRFFIRPGYLNEIEGDMEEIYHDWLEEHSYQRANWLYAKEVLMLIRPALTKKFSGNFQLNRYGMFKNYIKTSLRSLKKNILFSTINLAGLAFSMSIGIMMILFLTEVASVDDFHQHKERIYRVTSSEIRGTQQQTIHTASASYYIGQQLKEQVPGVSEVVTLRDSKTLFDLSGNEKTIPVAGYYASASFFDVFSFSMLQGNPESALEAPNSIVLTESTAKRLFGDLNPLGQLVQGQKNGFMQNGAAANLAFSEGIVTGVMQDPPANSHLQFEALISFNTLNQQATQSGRDFRTNPGNTSHLVYLLLDEKTNALTVENAAMELIADFNTSREDNPMVHHLQPMSEFFTSDEYHSVGPSFSQERIYLMIGLTLIILLSACFNYTNLSLARALRRSKEVGIRKVIGATRFQVFAQFVTEAVILSMSSLVVGLLIFYVLRPAYLQLAPPSLQGYDMIKLQIEAYHLAYFLLFALVVGLLGGLLPASFLSKLKNQLVSKSKNQQRAFSQTALRKGLIVCQFALSIGLITTAVLVNQQYQYALNYSLGYETENILTVDIQGDYIELLENTCKAMPEVTASSKSSWVLGVGGDGLNAGMMMSRDMKSRSLSLINEIDKHYLEMHGIEMLAGRPFDSPLSEEATANTMIVNPELLKQLDLGSPEEAIGKSVLYNGQQMTIQGVFKDAVSIGLTKKFIESLVFIQTPNADRYKSLNLKVQSDDLGDLMSKIEAAYLALDPVHPFNANLYEDKIARSYKSDKSKFSIVSFLALISVSISTLGLLGMAVFTMETRMKEISIRKVLGAGTGHLSILLSRNFLLLIAIAGLIAIPITWHIVDNNILNDFWQRAEAGPAELLSGLFIVLAISIITMGWQVLLAIVKNPADLLRNE